jgi:hypothetical protein
MNVYFLVNHLHQFPTQTSYVADLMWINFYNQISTEHGIILGQPHLFVNSVNKTLKQMDTIYNSVKNSNCNLIWAILFNKIRNVALNYYVFIVNKDFLKLEFRYSKEKLNITEITNEALVFMGLNEKYTKEDLVRSYRRLVLQHHPDKKLYGSNEMFLKLQVYKEQLERKFIT